jgi:flagellar hook assembly protein FlgD
MSLLGANPGAESHLQFTLASDGPVTLRIFDLQGRVVRTLLDQDAAAGTFSARWDGRSDDGARMGRGVYFARLVAGKQTTEKKVVLE